MKKLQAEAKAKGLSSTAIQDEIYALNDEADAELRSRIKGWSGLKDSDGKNVPFAEDVLDIMMNSQPYHMALNDGQYAATGELEKNS